jgi:hypothetical protein
MGDTKALLLPALLYGDYESTGEAWTRVVQAGSKDPHRFPEYLRGLRMIHYDEQPGKLVLDDCELGTEPCVPHWRLHWVFDALTSVRVQGRTFRDWALEDGTGTHATPQWWEEANAVSRWQRSIVLSGMEYLWFSLPMLTFDSGCFGFQLSSRDFRLAILRRLVWWLPEFVALLPLFYYGTGVLTRCMNPDDPNWWHLWGWLFYLISQWNPGVDALGIRVAVEAKYEKDVIAGLLGEGIIEEAGSRYRLKE